MKTALTVGALAVTGYSRLVGMRLEKAGGPPVEGTTEPNHQTPANVARQPAADEAAPVGGPGDDRRAGRGVGVHG